MARDYATEAVVMGSHKLGDADRVVSLFTEASGRVPTVVKGVRKVGSRFGGRLEPMTILSVRLHEGRNLYTLTAADTISTNASIRDDPFSLRAGLSFIELLSRSTTEFERRPRTWNMVRRCLPALDRAARRSDSDAVRSIVLGGQLKLLLLAGFLPHLQSCAACGADGSVLTRFSAASGGAICPDCPGESFSISPPALQAMRFLLEHPLASASELSLSPDQAREIWRSVREICRHHLGANLRVEPWI
ncbi:MAG: DNA repair protein RecO [Gaiellales bacterium]|nr:MAG: DNA repair protein RecO [Gaiellales bacterium]